MIGWLSIAANTALMLSYMSPIPEQAFGTRSPIERAMERFDECWIEALAPGQGPSAAVGDVIVVEFIAFDSRGIVVADTSARGAPYSVKVEEGSDWHLLTYEMKPGERRRVTFRPSSDKNAVYTVELRLVRVGRN